MRKVRYYHVYIPASCLSKSHTVSERSQQASGCYSGIPPTIHSHLPRVPPSSLPDTAITFLGGQSTRQVTGLSPGPEDSFIAHLKFPKQNSGLLGFCDLRAHCVPCSNGCVFVLSLSCHGYLGLAHELWHVWFCTYHMKAQKSGLATFSSSIGKMAFSSKQNSLIEFFCKEGNVLYLHCSI